MSPISFFQRHPRADLSAYLDGELKSGALLRLEAHIASCEACAAQLEEMRETRSLLRSLPEAEAPHSFALTPEMARDARPVRYAPQGRNVQPLMNGLRMTSGGLAVALAVAVIIGVSGGGGSDSASDASLARNLESTAEQYSANSPSASVGLAQSDAPGDDAAGLGAEDPAAGAPTTTPVPQPGGAPQPTATPGGVGGVGGGGSGTTGSAPDATASATTVPTDKTTSPPVESPAAAFSGEADQGADGADRNTETSIPDAVTGDLNGAEPLLEDGPLAATGAGADDGTSALTVVTIVLGALLAAALIGSIAASRLARKTP